MGHPAPPIDEALPALRSLLDSAHAQYRIVGGLAVAHHGYLRTTEDIDVLITAADADALDFASHGFERTCRTRLRHIATGVVVDLLLAGEPMPRPNEPPYPLPEEVGASPGDNRVISLHGLLTLKLRARRYRDLADVVQLLKGIDDARYLALKAAVASDLRAELARLRDDALEEMRFEQR